MKKVFETIYDGHMIEVENTWFHGERLYINGQLQDERLGLALRETLTGELKYSDGETKPVKVTIGGFLRIHCRVFVDHTLLIPSIR